MEVHGECPSLQPLLSKVKRSSVFGSPFTAASEKEVIGLLGVAEKGKVEEPRDWHNRLQRVVHRIFAKFGINAGSAIEAWNQTIWSKSKHWLLTRRQTSMLPSSEQDLLTMAQQWFDEAKLAWGAAYVPRQGAASPAQPASEAAVAPFVSSAPREQPIQEPMGDWRTIFLKSAKAPQDPFESLHSWLGIGQVAPRLCGAIPHITKIYQELQL